MAARDESERALLETLAIRSAMVLPLVAGDRCFGVLALSSLQPNRHGQEDFDLAKELARRLAVALDRARLYKETLESYALLEGLLASAPVGIGFWDRELRFVRVNEALAEINGIPPEAHIGRTLAEVLPELAPQLEPIYRRVLETGVPLIHEETTAETPTRPGGLRHWLTSYYPVVQEGGEPLGMAAVIMEITEQKRAEEALHRSEERFRSLVTASTNIVWTTDASGAMVDESRSWEAFTGQLPAEYTAPGWGWLDAIHPDDRQHAATRWRSAIEAAEPVETSYRLRRGDGEYRRMAVSAIPILGPDGLLREWVGTSTDVEEEQRSRTAVEEARERLGFLAEASRQLAASLDYERTLATVTNLPVGRIADWASVILFEAGGAVRRVAHAHVEPEGDELLDQLWWSYPLQLDDENPAGPPLRAGETVFLPEIEESSLAAFARDEEHLRLLRELGYASSIAVPFVVGGDAVGALTLVRSKQSAPYTQDDVELAEELARRAAIALDNARLFREAEDRARAAQALEFVGDGVFLVDREGLIRIWNPAAETITGLDPRGRARPVRDRGDPGLGCVRRARSDRRLTGRRERASRDPAARDRRPRALGLDLRRRLRRGHRLRLPGHDRRARRREDEERLRLDGVARAADAARRDLRRGGDAAPARHAARGRPARPAAGRDLGGGRTARAHRQRHPVDEPDRVGRPPGDDRALRPGRARRRRRAGRSGCTCRRASRWSSSAPDGLSELAADPDKVRQVLTNLVDNAVKYSPDGGHVEVRLERGDDRLRFLVADEGLGIPACRARARSSRSSTASIPT